MPGHLSELPIILPITSHGGDRLKQSSLPYYKVYQCLGYAAVVCFVLAPCDILFVI